MKQYDKTLSLRDSVLDEVCRANGNRIFKQNRVVGKLIVRSICAKNGWAIQLGDYWSSGRNVKRYPLAL